MRKAPDGARYRTLKELKEREDAIDAAVQRVFTNRTDLDVEKRAKRHKRRSSDELMLLLDIDDIRDAVIRSADIYAIRTYNLRKQLHGLLNHLFVRYEVPEFIYSVCIKPTKYADPDPFAYMHGLYRQWFLLLAQGGSFQKAVKGLMTSREAVVFLQAPATRWLHENVWWAKLVVAGAPAPVADTLVDRLFTSFFFDDPNGQMAEVIRFFVRHHASMNKVTFDEVIDFLAWKLRNEPKFSMRGRTVKSVIKLTNDWHGHIQGSRLSGRVSWLGLKFPDLEFETRDRYWVMRELRSNHELLNEGRKQGHCVYSYVYWCVSGRSYIFSLRYYPKVVKGYTEEGMVVWDTSQELGRVTVEVNAQRQIVQARGPMNRRVTEDEAKVIRRWSGMTGLTIRS